MLVDEVKIEVLTWFDNVKFNFSLLVFFFIFFFTPA